MPVLLFLPKAGARWRLRAPATAAVAAATRPALARRSGCGDSSRRAMATAMGTSAGRRPLSQLLQVATEVARKVSRVPGARLPLGPRDQGQLWLFSGDSCRRRCCPGTAELFRGRRCAAVRQRTETGVLSEGHLRKTVQEKCLNPRLKSPERGQILSPSIDLDTLLWSTGRYQVKIGF